MKTAESEICVLIIDDDRVIRESVGVYLEDSGFMIREAENGRIGLEMFRSERPDIILVDLRMPEVDGLDVLSAVTEEAPELPIIVVSGTGVLQDAVEALRLGAWDYVTKPVQDMEVLEHAVCKALERARLIIENRKYREHLESEIRKRTAELEVRTRELEIANQRLKEEMAENRRIEKQFRHAQKMEALGTLAGGIAHDFNNILFPIIGYTEMIMDDVDSGSQASRNLGQILKAAFRAKELVYQILSFSRGTDSERSPLKIRIIIKEALKLIRATLPSTIEIQREFRDADDTILGDPTQIHQILMNLFTNAYHAMRKTGGVLTVKLAGFQLESASQPLYPNLKPGRYIRITVADTGHGITEEIREHIFDPYFTTKEMGEGTGLGLSVVHGIVKNHEGHITVRSRPDEGTEFELLLPAAPSADRMQKADTEGEVPGGDERILLVDDEFQIAQMEEMMLSRMGYRVTMMTDSRAALDTFLQAPDAFDIVITDMTMPQLTGVEIARRMIEIRPDIPIILCTGFSELVTKEKAAASGIQEFVMKPMLKTEMAAAIRRALKKADSGQKDSG